MKLSIGIAIAILLAGQAHANLLTNGDFSQGNQSFTTNYDFDINTDGKIDYGKEYLIASNAKNIHTVVVNNFYDHTVGTESGMMLAGAGSSSSTDVIWSETISVSQDTNYIFSMWATNWSMGENETGAIFDIYINDFLVGTFQPVSLLSWVNYQLNWDSNSSANAIIKIVDTNTQQFLNDFLIDDLSFDIAPTPSPVPEPTTILLFGSGLLGLAAAGRRRWHN